MAVCSKCGAELAEGAATCAQCGLAVSSEAAAATQPQVTGFGGPATPSPKRSYAGVLAVVIILIIAVAALAYYFVFRAPAMLDMAKLAPSDAVVYFTVDLRPTPEHTEAIQPIIDRIKAKGLDQRFEQWLSTVQGPGTKITFKQDIEPWFGGQAAVSLSTLAPPRASLLVSCRDKAKAAAFLEKVKQRIPSAGSWKSEEYQEATIWSLPGMPLAIAVSSQAVVVTTSVDEAKGTIDRAKGKAKGLADEAGYQKALGKMPPTAVFASYMVPEGYGRIMQSLMGMMGGMMMPGGGPPMPPMPRGPGAPPMPPMRLMGEPMGMPGMPPTTQQMEQGMKAITAFYARMEAMGSWLAVERAGLSGAAVTVFKPGKGWRLAVASGETLRRIPESAIAVVNLGSPKGIWDLERSLFQSLPLGPQQQSLDEILKQFRDLTGLDLERDLIGWMTGECTLAFLGLRSDQMPMAVGIFQTGQPAQLKQAIQKIKALVSKKFGMALPERAGVTTIPVPASAGSIKPSFAVTKDALVIGTHPELVQGKTARRSILDKRSFRDTVGELPANNQGLFFVDLTEVWKTVDSAIGKGTGAKEWARSRPFAEAFKTAAAWGGQEGDVATSIGVLKMDFGPLIDAIAEAAK